MSLVLALWIATTMDHHDRVVAITEFLTAQEIRNAVALYLQGDKPFAKHCADTIIKPVLGRINTTLGQENDALYLAYAVEYVFGTLGNDKIKMLLE